MNLEQWVQHNLNDLNHEKPSPSAIKELVSVSEREIGDAKSVSSFEGKLTHAYAACLSIARSALAVCGFRIRGGSRSHHYKSIESLEYTIGLTPEEVREIQNYRQARHQSIYDFASVVSPALGNPTPVYVTGKSRRLACIAAHFWQRTSLFFRVFHRGVPQLGHGE